MERARPSPGPGPPGVIEDERGARGIPGRRAQPDHHTSRETRAARPVGPDVERTEAPPRGAHGTKALATAHDVTVTRRSIVGPRHNRSHRVADGRQDVASCRSQPDSAQVPAHVAMAQTGATRRNRETRHAEATTRRVAQHIGTGTSRSAIARPCPGQARPTGVQPPRRGDTPRPGRAVSLPLSLIHI